MKQGLLVVVVSMVFALMVACGADQAASAPSSTTGINEADYKEQITKETFDAGNELLTIIEKYQAGEISKEEAISSIEKIGYEMTLKQESLDDEILSAKALAVSAMATSLSSDITLDKDPQSEIDSLKDFLDSQEEVVEDSELK